MKRVHSSRADLNRPYVKRRRLVVVLEQRALLATVCLILPTLYTFSHATLFSRANAVVGTTHTSPPPAAPARCTAEANEQGWALLDELQQHRYTRAVLQARRDALLDRSTARAPAGNAADAVVPLSATQQAQAPFLFIGVLSPADNRAQRDALRQAWLDEANRLPGVQAEFLVFGADNENMAAAAQQESSSRGDIMLVDVDPANSTMTHRTYMLLEHALGAHSPKFVVKAEDTTFINVRALVEELRANCRNSGCHMERMYFGQEMNSTRSQQQVDAAYAAHTSLKAYMPYMLGGGYVLSSDLAQVILETNQQQGGSFLKFMPSEDISIGVWLMSLDLRRINHPQVLSLDGCTPEEMQQSGSSCRVDVCSPWRPPIMLQHVPNRATLLELGVHLRQCSHVQSLQSASRQLAAQELASALRPRLPEGAVLHLSPPDAASQFLLGGYAGRQWSPDGQQLLALRVPEGIAQPGNMRIEIGVFQRRPGGGWRWQQLNSAAAWNSRRGPMLQWLGPTSRYIVFNDVGCNSTNGGSSASFAAWMLTAWGEQQHDGSGGIGAQLCSVVYDLHQMTRSRSLPTALYAVSPDGRLATTLSFERLNAAGPGSGYLPAAKDAALKDASSSQGGVPTGHGPTQDDGVWIVDMATGQQHLLVSLQQLFDAVQAAAGATLPAAAITSCSHWVDSPQFNPSSAQVAFTYHIGRCQDGQPQAYLLVADAALEPSSSCGRGAEGQQLNAVRLVQLPEPSLRPPCFSFMPNGQLLVGSSAGFYTVDTCSMHIQVLNAPTTQLGGDPVSCTIGGPGGRHVLVSSRSGTGRRRRLAVWDRLTGVTSMVGEYSASAEGRSGFSHVGLQPAWSPDGATAVFDSSHNGQGWQVYEAAMPQPGSQDSNSAGLSSMSSALLGGGRSKSSSKGLPDGLTWQRHVYIDLGSQEGASVARFLERQGRKHPIQVYAWEPDARHLPRLQQVLQRLAGLHKHSSSVQNMAAWTADGKVPFYPYAVSAEQGKAATPVSSQKWWQRLAHLLTPVRDARFGSMYPPQDSHEQAGAANSSSSSGQEHGSQEHSSQERTSVLAADFGAWLLQHVEPQDHVTVHMDIAGAEFDVLPALIRDGSITLIDEIRVVWSTSMRPEYVDWPAAFRSVFSTLGIRELV